MRQLALALQLNTLDDLGRDAIGEHVWRVSGARHLAALNLPRVMIKLLARWGGETIDRYIRDAPLRALTVTYNAVLTSQLPPTTELLCPAAAVSHLTSAAIKTSGSPDDDQLGGDSDDDPVDGRFVYNPKTKMVHMVRSRCDWSRGDAKRTACGKLFQQGWDPPNDTIPSAAKNKCDKCAPPHVWLAALEAPSESD
jgi:hypothetical protein